MSLYRQQKTSMNDHRSLIGALQSKGFTPLYNPVAQQLEGYHGDLRKETAEIILPRAQVGGASNDIGFKRIADGSFAAIISAFDSTKYNAAWLREVKTLALESKAKRIAVDQLELEPTGREVLPSGKIRLQFVKRGR